MKTIGLKSLLFLVLTGLCFYGCTRDDLCPAGSATTPNLIVIFKDADNPDARKQVALNIFMDNAERTPVLRWKIADSIAMPLNVNSNSTPLILQRYLFQGNDTLYWEDKVRFTYDRKDVYVNRACGFRSEFHDFDATAETHHWIKYLTPIKDSVADEKSAHLTIHY